MMLKLFLIIAVPFICAAIIDCCKTYRSTHISLPRNLRKGNCIHIFVKKSCKKEELDELAKYMKDHIADQFVLYYYEKGAN